MEENVKGIADDESSKGMMQRSAGSHPLGIATRLWRRSGHYGFVLLAHSNLSAFLSAATRLGPEFLLILAWTVFVTRPYLDLGPNVVPAGREFLSGIQTHHIWTRAPQCGLCALWDGSERGGAPAFANLHGSMLYPMVIVTTLLFGVLNGTKLTLVFAFFLFGVAQWLLGYVLGLGRVARAWTAAMAVSSGFLAGQMDLGAFGVVLSAATAALVLPQVLVLSRTASRKAAVLLGLELALLAVAGQGYIQIGLLFVFPAVVFLLPSERKRLGLLLRRYALAGIVGVLLSAPLIVPFAHFLPEFTKEYDPAIKSGQPLVYVPLNLVIDDYDFYTSTSLQKLPFPEINVNFLGWIPVLLAVWGFFGSGNREIRRAILFLGATSTLAMLVASGEPLRLLASIPVQWISDLASGVRHPGQIVGLSVLPVLGLAGIGTDRLLTGTSKKISLVLSGDNWRLPPFSFDLGLLVAIPLLFALNQTRAFGTHWIYSTPLSPAVPVTVEALRTPSLEWVNPPYGEHEWIESAVRAGLKLSYGYRTWDWKNRSSPEPILWAQYANVPADMTIKSTVAGIPVYVAGPEREYALVTHADGAQTICTALGIGGDIDVTCNISRPGDLEVKENSWEGWFLTVDGTAAELLPGRWLAVSLTAGNHHIGFRYRPWDVPLGIALAVVGVGVSIYCWRKREDPTEDLPEYHA